MFKFRQCKRSSTEKLRLLQVEQIEWLTFYAKTRIWIEEVFKIVSHLLLSYMDSPLFCAVGCYLTIKLCVLCYHKTDTCRILISSKSVLAMILLKTTFTWCQATTTHLFEGGRRGRGRMIVCFATCFICNQCLSPQTLWVRILFYSIVW